MTRPHPWMPATPALLACLAGCMPFQTVGLVRAETGVPPYHHDPVPARTDIGAVPVPLYEQSGQAVILASPPRTQGIAGDTTAHGSVDTVPYLPMEAGGGAISVGPVIEPDPYRTVPTYSLPPVQGVPVQGVVIQDMAIQDLPVETGRILPFLVPEPQREVVGDGIHYPAPPPQVFAPNPVPAPPLQTAALPPATMEPIYTPPSRVPPAVVRPSQTIAVPPVLPPPSPLRIGTSAVLVETLDCKYGGRAWGQLLEGEVMAIDGDTATLRLTERYGIWHNPGYEGIDTTNWWCSPRRGNCLSPIPFDKLGGRNTAGETLTRPVSALSPSAPGAWRPFAARATRECGAG